MSAGEPTYLFWFCVLKAPSKLLAVDVPLSTKIYIVKEQVSSKLTFLVKEQASGKLDGYTAGELEFYKPGITLQQDDCDAPRWAETLQSVEREDMKNHKPMSKYFAGPPHPNVLHFMVVARGQIPLWTPRPLRRPSAAARCFALVGSANPLIHSDDALQHIGAPRQDTVHTLYMKLNAYNRIQVRGTPASGKSSLLELLHQHILSLEPGVRVYVITSWPKHNLEVTERMLQILPTYPESPSLERWPYLMFDNAQSTYWDGNLWSELIREDTKKPYRIILFCSYGSPGACPVEHENGTPMTLHSSRRVSLRPTSADEHEPIGLLLNREEYREVVQRFPDPLRLDQTLEDEVFRWTSGHAGAIENVLKMISRKKRHHFREGKDFTLANLYEEIPLPDFIEGIEHHQVFTRGLPLRGDLATPAVARVLKGVLQGGLVTGPQPPSNDETDPELVALRECYRRGWVYPELEEDDTRIRYTPSSPLHGLFISWRLVRINNPPSYNMLFDLVVDVIKIFQPSILGESLRRVGASSDLRLPEAAFQDEFYRCHFDVSSGTVRLSSEFSSQEGATKIGRIDFFIPSKQWGIEFTRDGNRLEQHSARFGPSGAYGAWIASQNMVDYIILDCRTTVPQAPHPAMHKLYHVIFNSGLDGVKILNNMLEEVADFGLIEH